MDLLLWKLTPQEGKGYGCKEVDRRPMAEQQH